MYNYHVDEAGALSGPITFAPIPGFGPHAPGDTAQLPKILPTAKAGHCWTLIEGIPQQVIDKRGTVYRTDSGAEQAWNTLGTLPNGFTDQPWPGEHHVWIDGNWVLDKDARRQADIAQIQSRRDHLLQDAQLRIVPLEYAEKLSSATDAEKAALQDWMHYCVELNRLELQDGFPDPVNWPKIPKLLHRR